MRRGSLGRRACIFLMGGLLNLGAVSDAPLTVLETDALTFSDRQLKITIHLSQCAEPSQWRSMRLLKKDSGNNSNAAFKLLSCNFIYMKLSLLICPLDNCILADLTCRNICKFAVLS